MECWGFRSITPTLRYSITPFRAEGRRIGDRESVQTVGNRAGGRRKTGPYFMCGGSGSGACESGAGHHRSGVEEQLQDRRAGGSGLSGDRIRTEVVQGGSETGMRLQIGKLTISMGSDDPVKAVLGAVVINQIPWDSLKNSIVQAGISSDDADKVIGITQQYLSTVTMKL